ncbi:hypothetical protein [Aidingimonas lacisalsi]|uniref:hypothetical protein n=1 Tax=Aidingimonas lacisalsi TaxID=2604086 RepID=UPI0011D2AC00|nr:hypothetical protein [Aidingimonas lacisalsi]
MQITSVASFQPYQSPTATPVRNVQATEHTNASRSGENAGARANDLAWIQAVQQSDGEDASEPLDRQPETSQPEPPSLDDRLTAQLMQADAQGWQGDATRYDALPYERPASVVEAAGSPPASATDTPPASNDSAIALYNALAGSGVTAPPGGTLNTAA